MLHVQDMTQDAIASHFAQALLRVGGAPWWHRLHAALGPSLKPMAKHPTANFVVQALLESAPSAEPFARCMGA